MSDQEKATRDRKIHFEAKTDLGKGQREKYFADDDMTVDQMVQREKLNKGGDLESNLVDNLGKRRGPVRDVFDEDEEYGGGLGTSLKMMESRDKKMKTAVLEDRARKQMIHEHNRAEAVHNKDRLDLDNSRFPKHLLLAVATRTYLMLKPNGRLTDGHCLIVPQQSVPSTLQCDEDTLDEIRNFKKCLLQTFHQMDMDCIFFETAISLDRMPHASVECVPLVRDKSSNAPMYFKKAIMEVENEFESQNRALIDTRGVKKLATKIPKHMPYFSVEFGLQGGFAHVVENERKFPKTFGADILCGILGLPATITQRERSSIEHEKQLAAAFLASYEPFDWTKMLREG
uniref:Cwf19-like C-terminal domain-containing protein n=1 Tax=Guillardia theta TaxID=55529 RepID=A0A7S4KQA5_GUITH